MMARGAGVDIGVTFDGGIGLDVGVGVGGVVASSLVSQIFSWY